MHRGDHQAPSLPGPAYSVMRTIRLHGVLAERCCTQQIAAHINSPAEAVRLLLANFPGLERLIRAHDWIVRAGSMDVDEDLLHFPAGQAEEIEFVPLIQGAGAGGRIITGALLIAASFFVPGVALAGIALGPLMFGIGASLLLGGVSQLLTPKTPTARRDRDPREVKSFSISGVQNTSRQGVPVNVILGEAIVGGIVISAGVTTDNLPSTGSASRSSSSARSRSGEKFARQVAAE
jgi:predicted phage tail protein